MMCDVCMFDGRRQEELIDLKDGQIDELCATPTKSIEEDGMRLPNVTDNDIDGLMPCPSCPDGNVWDANGPTGKCCPKCNGHAVVHLDSRPIATELGLPIELQP